MQIILEDELDHIRYISKDDHFDSRFDDYDVIFQFKNLVNEMYAEDISKKVHSSLDDKQRAGKFIGAFAPYGYSKDPLDKNRLVIDEEPALVVKRLFQMRLRGMNVAQIARILNDEEIPSPLQYKRSQGAQYVSPTAKETNGTHLWEFSSIARMLRNQTYAGDLVQGRTRQKMRKKPMTKKREDWVIAKAAVPPLVTAEDFTRVQKLLDEAGHFISASGKEHIFAGVLRCGECGKAFVKHQTRDDTLYFVCGTRKRNGKKYCCTEYIRYDVLEKILLNDLNGVLKEIRDIPSLIDNGKEAATANEEENRIPKMEREKENLIRRRRAVYADYADGLMSKTDYLYFKTENEKREAALSRQIAALLSKSTAQQEVSPWIEKFLEFGVIDSLDREIIAEMVSSIQIYRNRSLVITYKFEESQECAN